MLNKTIRTLLLLVAMSNVLFAQDKVTFIASDKLIVTGDLYKVSDTMPYMILCHDQKSSRGEYKETAKKFTKLGYNCIAIDLRNGGTCNGVNNETADLAQLKHLPTGMLDAKMDIQAAVTYAFGISSKKVVIVGSGYSASLALAVGSTDARVASVLAFSPGDYFGGKLSTKDAFSKYTSKSVYVASSKTEGPEVKKYVADIPSSKLTQFTPASEGGHGANALTTADQAYHEYWISILMYMRNVSTK